MPGMRPYIPSPGKGRHLRGGLECPSRMRHTHIRVFVHIVFSTKNRRNTIREGFRQRLWSYMGGIARANKLHAIIIGGMGDHAHLLLAIPSTIAIGRAVQMIKMGSSTWVRENEYKLFQWQEGFAAFSVSQSNLEKVKEYVCDQERHHRKMSFAEEWNAFLQKHGISLTRGEGQYRPYRGSYLNADPRHRVPG
ncbi:MAG: IS200/IS605 family transposase [Acidobacteria bacterium]|nr:MAG: IS200/IS605 family transposase [Acidobacteriota bacterium]